jgi:hypothetical protein
MSDAAARAAITQLHAEGVSYAEIARRLERSPRFVTQIARGERGPGYGRSAAPALEQLAANRTAAVTPPAQRKTAVGTIARVRGKATPIDDRGNITFSTKAGYKTLEQQIDRAGREHRQVNVIIQAKSIIGDTDSRRGDVVELFRNGGYDANSLMNRLEDLGYDDNPLGAVLALAEQRGIEVRGVESITINTGSKREMYR